MSTSEQNLTTVDGIFRSLDEISFDLCSLAPAHRALFDTLPPETIQDIFIYACPNISLPMEFDSHMKPSPRSLHGSPLKYVDPMMLAMVCRRWRAITVAQHSLWATIAIETSRIMWNEWKQWATLQLLDRLERSGTHPLKISIRSAEYNTWGIPTVLDSVILHSGRWTSIDFVQFSLADEYVQKFASFSAPLLKHLGLWCNHETYLWNTQIPWKQITDIALNTHHLKTEQQWHETLSLLSVKSLAALTLSSFSRCNSAKTRQPIILPKLQQLRFLGPSKGVLDMLVCPSLQQLDINTDAPHEIKTFLDNSCCTLIHFQLGPVPGMRPGGVPGDGDILRHSSLSSVKSIALNEITDPVLDLLVLDSRDFLPSLDTLFLDLAWADTYPDTKKIAAVGINRLQKILDYRTYGAQVNRHETFLDNVRSHFTQINMETPVRNFSAHLFTPPPNAYNEHQYEVSGVLYM